MSTWSPTGTNLDVYDDCSLRSAHGSNFQRRQHLLRPPRSSQRLSAKGENNNVREVRSLRLKEAGNAQGSLKRDLPYDERTLYIYIYICTPANGEMELWCHVISAALWSLPSVADLAGVDLLDG